MQVLHRVLDVILPRRCVGCKRTGMLLCHFCLLQVPLALPADLDLIACYEYHDSVMRRALWKMKYARGIELVDTFAEPLAEELVLALTDLLSPPEPDEEIALVPVPLHPKRLRERGYNQAELIARALAERIPGTVVYPSLLMRTQNTVSQTKMKSRKERERNVEDAFALSGDTTLPRIAIVIDDIITSGATTRACARLLRHAGARTVLRAAVAHGAL